MFTAALVRPVEILIPRLLAAPLARVHHVEVLAVTGLNVELDRLRPREHLAANEAVSVLSEVVV